MKKRLFTFFCTMAVLLLSQSAWAAQGDATINKLSQSNARLNSIVGNNYEYTTEDGFMKVVITGEHAVAYSTESDVCQDVAKLTFGHVKANEKFNFKFQVSKPGAGYELTLISARTLTKMVGTYGYYALGNHNEELINNTAGAWTDQKAAYTALTTEVPFYFRGGSARIGGNLGAGACMEKYELEYLVVPNAPTWDPATDNVKVTVNHTQDAYLHWIDLSSYIQVGNDAFKGTVKYEAVGLDAKYIMWNADSTKCYIIKPGTYEFRAYIDKKDGVYCSSAYTATNLQLKAEADAAEKDNAQVFYMIDDKLANEYDKTNHYWMVKIPWVKDNKHYVEYIYAFDGEYQFVKKTTYCLNYLDDTDPASDHFNVVTSGVTDTTEIKIDGAHHSWLEIKATKADNHVTFTINSQEMFDALVTSVSTQEGKDVFWDNNRIRFARFNTDYTRKRTMEITFTGVPDSLIMLYGNNAESQENNVRLSIEYYDGAWHDFQVIEGRPDKSSEDKAKRFAYQLPASASKLRFAYWGAQYLGFIHDLTVTERKGLFLVNVPVKDTIFFEGRHKIGGKVEKQQLLNWYNLYPALQELLVNNDTAQFFTNITKAGVKALALDDFAENQPVVTGMKLDSVGVFNTNLMIWNGTADMKEVPGGKKVYGCVLHGVVGYNADELILKDTLATDTVVLNPGETLPNPFELQDTTGNIIKDSLEYEYEVTPDENAIEIDENGNIKALCVGVTKVVAKLKENMLIPGGLTDTLYIYVPELAPQTFKATIPAEIAIGDKLTNLVEGVDENPAITYSFNPAAAATDKGGNQIEILMSGVIEVKATAAQTCSHFTKDTTFTINAREVLNPSSIVIDPAKLTDLYIGDSINNLVVVKGTDGQILDNVKITYEFTPSEKVDLKDTTIYLLHAGEVTVNYTISGDTIKTVTGSVKFTINKLDEEVVFVDLPDTLFVGQKYDMADYTVTNSGRKIDQVEVFMFSYMYEIDGTKVTANQTFTANIRVTANGNDDYQGPAQANQIVTFVVAVKPIDWSKLEPLDDKHKGDTIPVNDVPVIDEKGNDITNQVTKTYEFLPDMTYAHLDSTTNNVVIDKAGEIYMIVTTEGEGYETKRDTILIQSVGYTVDSVEIPGASQLGNLHVGDTLNMQGVAEVFDIKGRNITDKVDTIIYTIEPQGAAHFDEQGNIVVDENTPFVIICELSGDELAQHPSYDTIYVNVNKSTVGQVTFPAVPADGYHVGDTIKAGDIRVYDENGKDITPYCDSIQYVFVPSDGAHVDENGNIIIDKSGIVTIQTIIGGNNTNPYMDQEEIYVKKYTTNEIIIPTKPGDDDYYPGDKIIKNDIVVLDNNGKDVTDKATIKITWEPQDAAHLDTKGNLVFDKPGKIVVTTCVSGEGLTEKCVEKTYIVRHDETGCYPLLTQVWNDVLAVNNNEELHINLGLPVFVSYEWYREEELLAGENNQDYHISANEIADSAYYYVRATGVNGQQYLLCELLVNKQDAPKASTTFKVYPTIVSASDKYTVEVNQSGVVYVTTSNGSAMGKYEVAKGKNVISAPASNGVYVLQFAPAAGAYEVQKLIVK